ncbi:hypothetical protein GKZ68_06005 [Hymenobacter sp. BRD128]|uniref:hypothetical protein n=1 Tax=Hymenobacter sp. BRD128 TaxID=2675878 RepID=UPI001563C339|nr:hypothetical protein [Hymenobacter sp. BRD128]QKG56237.1 hypothetical protein GKZ68_06005 [Hymenobacter sp. BRD128]
MSSVTNLMLSFSVSEEEQTIASQLNSYPNKERGFLLVSIDDDRLPRGWYGGSKMMETRIYLGAYNYLDVDDFINYLRSIEWESPEEVQLFTKGQYEDKFTVYNLLSE